MLDRPTWDRKITFGGCSRLWHMRCNCSELKDFQSRHKPCKRTSFSRWRVSSLPKLSQYIFINEKFLQFHHEKALHLQRSSTEIPKAGGRREGMGLSASTLYYKSLKNWENGFIKTSVPPTSQKHIKKKKSNQGTSVR